MIKITIPALGLLELSHLVVDFNGTVATDGKMIRGVTERLQQLAGQLSIHVITADTNGSVRNECRDIPVSVHIIGTENQDEEKRRFLESLPQAAAAVGNGRNDLQMFERAALAIAVLGEEGCCTRTVLQSDVMVRHIHDALDLLLKPNRLIATLRN
jgi:soluble P-type ATPase